MDKKIKTKTSNFFKKEGLYVILFVCLCVVATVASIVAKNSKLFNGKVPVANINSEVKPINDSVENKAQWPTNATQVKTDPVDQKTQIAQVETVPVAPAPSVSSAPTVQTAAEPVLSFVKPVAGTLLLGFSDLAQIEPTDSKTIQSIETVNGMYINCKIGQDVFSAETGVVIDSKDAINYGEVLTIKHENGYKSVYGNLSETKNVKVGDKVVRGQKIGTIGKTSNHYPSYKVLNDGFIYFQILKNDVPIDPATCSIKY